MLRDAAAVLVWARQDPPLVLWLRRALGQAFLGGFWSLPGGIAEPSDGDLRVTALRELFEETGLLLVTGASPDAAMIESLRDAFAESAARGHEAMRARGLRFRTGEIEPAGRWVTPDFSPIRFDARFFAVAVDAPVPLAPDPSEIDRVEWVSAADAVGRWERADALVAPPALAMLRTTARLGRVDPAAMRAWPGADGSDTLVAEIVPALQLLPLRTPTLPPATHTNAYFVGSREAVLIEPASPYPEEIARVVRWVEENARSGIRPQAILATHHHVDHVGGAVALRDALGLPIWAHERTADRLRGRVPVDRLIADGERIELDGDLPITLRALHTPGHAPGHLCFVEERSGAMIAGDMVASIGTIIVEPEDGDMELYLASLARMGEEDPKLLLPAHGLPIEEPQHKLDQYVAHRLMREAKVLDALLAHQGAAAPGDLVPRAYDDAPQAVWPLARFSTEAHLIKLERDGKARRAGDRWVAVR